VALGEPRGAPEPEESAVAPAAAARLQAATGLLRNHPDLLLPLASRFGEQEVVFESAIRGSSMAPTIASYARLQVRRSGQQDCRVGDVVYFQTEGGYVVHRILQAVRCRTGEAYLLTCGDRRLAPDPPIRADKILGTVVAAQTPEGWRGVEAFAPAAPRRVVRSLSLKAMVVATWYDPGLASFVARGLLALETAGRLWAGRVRRRLRRGR
jgi:hypothetical protein